MKLPPRALAIIAGSTLALMLQPLQAADAILNGNYLRLGVNDSGALIDSGFTVGIDYDKTGTSTWTGFDFLKPGTPFEFFSVGYNNSWEDFGYWTGGLTGSATTDTSAAGVLSTSTAGGSWGLLAIAQTLSYPVGGGIVNFAVTLTNTGTEALENVVYGRGLDPDQDVYAGGGYPTTNSIVNGNLVTGSAPVTDWTIGIFTDSAYAHTPSIQSGWDTNPYNLQNPRDDGYGDWTINMGWNVGTLGAGDSAVITFQYRVAETKDEVVVPGGRVPDTASTFAILGATLLGLAGIRRKIRA